MKKEYFEVNIDVEKTKMNFKNYVQNKSEKVDVDEIYGFYHIDKIELYKKKNPRSIRILCDYYIYGEINNDGILKYTYRRTFESIVFTIFAPMFMLIAGVLLGAVMLKIEAMYIWIFPATILLLCNMLKNKELRKDLKSSLSRLIVMI